MLFQFKLQLFAAAGLFVLSIPETAFAQTLSSQPVTATRDAGGINDDYSLPKASFPELSSAAHARLSLPPSAPRPSNQSPDDDRESPGENCL